MKVIAWTLFAALLLATPGVGQPRVQAQSKAPAQASTGQAQTGTMALPESREKLGGTNPTARIQREAIHELLMLPYYSVFDNLSFAVEGDNTIVLMGQVLRPSTKSDAEAAVKGIEGVEKVVNNIQVLPPSPMDDRLRRQLYRSIYSYGPLSKYSWGAVPSIHIIVDHGKATLVGVVDNQADKDAAGIRAKTVPGVFDVTNNLQVIPPNKNDNKEAKK